MTKPLIAAVHGAALAGGTGLAANCHIVVAAEDATFGLTEIRIGLWPFVIFRTIAAALGQRRATELALSGRIFPASEAREYGLVHHVVETANLLERAREIAGAIAEASPTAIHAGLAFVRDARGKSWEEAGDLARRMRNDVFRSADFQEGIRAFQEKRPPRWPVGQDWQPAGRLHCNRPHTWNRADLDIGNATDSQFFAPFSSVECALLLPPTSLVWLRSPEQDEVNVFAETKARRTAGLQILL
jgi:hypothetical protein